MPHLVRFQSLDPSAFTINFAIQESITIMAGGARPSVAVIGAGAAGLAVAK
jgi:NADPH-dependent 2,4-dienoyl-CoA reductase/sulfur reductase-like enzyme